MTQQKQEIDFSIVDEEMVKKIKDKKKRADGVMDIIREHGLDKDKKFMDEIEPLIDKLLQEK